MTIIKKLITAAVIIYGVLATSYAYALGLGNIEVDSYLNQPLSAEIGIVSLGSIDAERLKIKIAPAEEFAKRNLPRPDYLSHFFFNVETAATGSKVIKVYSQTPIRDPFIDFILEITWPQGRVMRQYTVLLDPPPAVLGNNRGNVVRQSQVKAKSTVPTATTNNFSNPNNQAASDYKYQQLEQKIKDTNQSLSNFENKLDSLLQKIDALSTQPTTNTAGQQAIEQAKAEMRQYQQQIQQLKQQQPGGATTTTTQPKPLTNLKQTSAPKNYTFNNNQSVTTEKPNSITKENKIISNFVSNNKNLIKSVETNNNTTQARQVITNNPKITNTFTTLQQQFTPPLPVIENDTKWVPMSPAKYGNTILNEELYQFKGLEQYHINFKNLENGIAAEIANKIKEKNQQAKIDNAAIVSNNVSKAAATVAHDVVDTVATTANIDSSSSGFGIVKIFLILASLLGLAALFWVAKSNDKAQQYLQLLIDKCEDILNDFMAMRQKDKKNSDEPEQVTESEVYEEKDFNMAAAVAVVEKISKAERDKITNDIHANMATPNQILPMAEVEEDGDGTLESYHKKNKETAAEPSQETTIEKNISQPPKDQNDNQEFVNDANSEDEFDGDEEPNKDLHFDLASEINTTTTSTVEDDDAYNINDTIETPNVVNETDTAEDEAEIEIEKSLKPLNSDSKSTLNFAEDDGVVYSKPQASDPKKEIAVSDELYLELEEDSTDNDNDIKVNPNMATKSKVAEQKVISDILAENNTKIELANTLIAMGDEAGAAELLQEVASYGEETQRQEAQALLAKLKE